MSDRAASSRGQAGKRLPENPIIQQTSKALEEFFTTALSELETKMKDVLQPRPGSRPVNLPIQLLTEQMIRELSENVRRVLGTAAAPDLPASAAAKDDPDLRASTAAKDRRGARRPPRRRPSGRQQ